MNVLRARVHCLDDHKLDELTLKKKRLFMAVKQRKLNKYLSSWGRFFIVLVSCCGLVLGAQWAWGESAISADGVDVAPETELDYAAALAELQTTFTFQGQPINPRAVVAMLPWLSDTLPGAIAVDIEGSTADTNQFLADVFMDESGLVTGAWEQFGERRFAGYRQVDQLADGTYVLRVFVNTGGNAVFPFVMLVNCDLDTEMAWNGELRTRLYMSRRGAFVLGMGYNGEITVAGQSVTFVPGLRGEATTTLNVPALPSGR
jgi:hypothetical protein